MASSSATNVRRRGRGEASRQAWSSKEEEVLIEALKQVIIEGWKTENGFRAGYLLLLEGHMRKAFPQTDLKANPHIKSRITTWKRNYASLTTILARSGVGFNLNGDHKVNCEEAEWEEIMKNDANAEKIYNKSWPLIDGWREVFGKDRATGDGAEDVMDTLNEFLHEVNEEAANNEQEASPFTEFVEPGAKNGKDEEVASVCNSSKNVEASSGSKSKRKMGEGTSNMTEVLGHIQRDMNARFDSLINKIGYNFDVAKMRKEVFNMIRELPEVSLLHSFSACDKLISKVERLEFFMALTPDERAAYVAYVSSQND